MLTRESSRSLRSWSRTLSTTLLASVALSALGIAGIAVVGATPASAHTELVRITPQRHGQATTAPTKVVLEFSEPVSSSFATVVVTTAAGVRVTSGKPTVVGAKVTQKLSPRLAAGTYRVAFRVVSNDGHPVTGQSDFTVTLVPTAGGSTTGPSASSPASPSAPIADVTPSQGPKASRGGGVGRSTVAIAGAVGLLIIGSGLVLWRRERP